LWFAVTLARCFNESDALTEVLQCLLPFDAARCREILEARQARGEKVFRTDAYKPPTSPNKGTGTIEFVIVDVLGPMWRERESLRPQPAETLGSYSDRLEQRYKIGPFLAAQIVADLKHVAPLNAAADWWDYARPGPGSERGLNRVRGRPIKTSWSQPHWHRELMQLGDEIATLFVAANLPRLDLQNLQNCLCEFDKWERARDAGGKPSRRYKSAAVEPPPKRKRARVEAAPTTTPTEPPQPQVGFSGVTEIPGEANERASGLPTGSPPEHNPDNDEVTASPIAAGPGSPIPENLLAALDADINAGAAPPARARGNSTGNDKSSYPHGERESGREEAFYIYRDARERYYLGVKRTSTKQFPQYHWDGTQWQKGAPKGAKIPYRLPELLDAPPEAWVVIAAGEKDALAAAALGFVATTNSGGEGKGQWTPELGHWFVGKQHVAIMEDNDDAGHAHAPEVATALRGIVPDIRIVRFRELKTHGDLTDWIHAVPGRGRAELLARIEAAAPAEPELEEWDAGELLGGTLPEPRQWLTAGQFCRTFLSGLVAPGDVGKTTLRLTQAIELATGRELVGLRVFQRCRVLVLSFEDDRAELHRRLLAICKHHGIDPSELKGWLFCRDLNAGPKLAELDSKGRRRQVGALEGMLRRAIARTRCDLLILDPFVKLHGLNESDNPDMDFVCSLLIKIAQDCNIAVDSPAHTHKGAITAGDADARRGASAQRDAGRLDYTFTVMPEDEAKQFGIAADVRKSYMRLDKAKANIVRAVKARWFQLTSVRLDNATALYPDGDEVQAVERWEPPETWAGVDGETLNAILDAIDAGLGDGRRYIDHGAAKGRLARGAEALPG
jgi:AAA domain/alpha-glutamyl/putrescinyl thymine pyrophosphorylase clade 1